MELYANQFVVAPPVADIPRWPKFEAKFTIQCMRFLITSMESSQDPIQEAVNAIFNGEVRSKCMWLHVYVWRENVCWVDRKLLYAVVYVFDEESRFLISGGDAGGNANVGRRSVSAVT